MSDAFLQLVKGLARTTPPARTAASPVAVRNKFLLFVLALLADENGRCEVSVGDLARLMECGDPAEVRKSIRFAEDQGYLVVVEQVSRPNEYRLLRAALEKRQLDHLLRANDSVYQLADYGLDKRPLNVLLRSPFTTLSALGAEIDQYLQQPAEERQGFHQWLEPKLTLTRLGKVGGQAILDAYAAWQADHPA